MPKQTSALEKKKPVLPVQCDLIDGYSQLPGEPIQSYRAFRKYRDDGVQRELRRSIREYLRAINPKYQDPAHAKQLYAQIPKYINFSIQWRWDERVTLYDEEGNALLAQKDQTEHETWRRYRRTLIQSMFMKVNNAVRDFDAKNVAQLPTVLSAVRGIANELRTEFNDFAPPPTSQINVNNQTEITIKAKLYETADNGETFDPADWKKMIEFQRQEKRQLEARTVDAEIEEIEDAESQTTDSADAQ